MSVKILALVTEAFGGRGGIARYNRDLFTALGDNPVASKNQAFYRLTIIPRIGRNETHVPKNVEQLTPKPSRIAYAIASLAVGILHRTDIVFCGHLHLSPIAAIIARINGAKLVVQMHGIEAWEQPSRFERQAVEAADLILCVSRFTRTQILKWAVIPPERVVVLPNTVSDIFSPGISRLRKNLGLDGKRVLLTVGRLDSREKYKGHDRVIRAMPAVLSDGHDLVYLIVGDGDDSERLELLARELGLDERVKLLKGIKTKELPDYYRLADLYVMPSTGEGFGITYLEAMATGIPALGLAVAGAVDPLVNGNLGTLTSEEELAISITELLNNKGEPSSLAFEVRRRFGLSRFTQEVQRLFANRLRGTIAAW